ncbi:uncharacterized protein [Lolium perenne]|nr:uncharacterized protein LOC127305702 isoform X2 [Lolium perenne]
MLIHLFSAHMQIHHFHTRKRLLRKHTQKNMLNNIRVVYLVSRLQSRKQIMKTPLRPIKVVMYHRSHIINLLIRSKRRKSSSNQTNDDLVICEAM